MVYGVLKLINFAHGDFFALGSYLGYTLLVFGSAWLTAHLGLWGGLLVTVTAAALCLALVGVVVERVAYRPIYPAGRLPAVVSALGASIILQNLIMIIWGPRYQAYPAKLIPNIHLALGGINLTALQLLILGRLLRPHGRAHRRDPEDHLGRGGAGHGPGPRHRRADGHQLQAGDPLHLHPRARPRAPLTGVMVGMYYRQISFTMGWNYGLKAFTATILGGIGNLPGAMFGGLILGVLEMLGSAYISTAWKDVFVFLILILVLIFRPTGLFGEKTAEKV